MVLVFDVEMFLFPFTSEKGKKKTKKQKLVACRQSSAIEKLTVIALQLQI